MIAYIKGSILKKFAKSVIIKTGELGYELWLSPKDIKEIKIEQPVEFFVYSYIKEDAFDLYGFKTMEGLDFFKKVIAVSGIGPKGALNVLALAKVADLKKAISQGDATFLQQVSGIGKKTAERLVVELKEKFINDLSADTDIGSGDGQVIDALISLGYKEKEAQDIVRQMPVTEGDLSSRIKEALKFVPK